MSRLSHLRRDLARKQGFLLLSLAVLVVDQWSKWLVETRLAGRPPLEVIPHLLDFTYVENTGVAFGLFASGGSVPGTIALSLLGLAGFGLLAYYFLRTPLSDRLLLSALGLVLGGAVGNLADRIATGAVTDFVDFYVGRFHWYTFNVADSAITVGVLLMSLDLLRPRKEDDEAKETDAAGRP